jgi:glucose/arabinose dehydrogenase/mono/diheme cytochrome c family protein
MLRLFPLLALLVISASPLLAQSGDKKGEQQKPLPADLKVPPAPVRTPEEQAATFKLAPGFRAELVAANPLVGDPVAMQFGPDGRLWVLEMRGYMPNPDGEGEREPVGVIAVLTDTDGDGRFDRRQVFADKLVMARAISLVGDGLLVAEPPILWFMRDTNGDGVADERTQVADDYGNTNNPEHNSNGLMWALDNWIYSANHTVRFRYEGNGKFKRENTVTRGQWGISQDDTGRIFYNSNSDPLRHDAIPSAYLRRNANFEATGANVQLVPGRLPIWPSRMTPGVNRGYQILNDEYKITSMTAASGPVVYRGTLFPAEFRGDAFVPEPTGNLIKRIKLTEQDGALSGANAYEGAEFMTSTDERFRPVNLYNGPDGALYVVDFYRGLVQHRIYLTSFLRKQVEERGLDKGIGNGRIWRIVPDGAPKAKYDVGLAKASTNELIEKLGDGNGWVRDTAQRLLIEQRDPAAAIALRKAALDAKRPALARLHALWTLEGIVAGIDRATVVAAVNDVDPRVVAAAVRVGESLMQPVSADADVIARVSALVKTRTEPAIRLQLALSLGQAKTAAADAALAELVVAAGRQPFLADAVVSGLSGREVAFVETLIAMPRAETNSGEVIRFAISAALKRDVAGINAALELAAKANTPEWARAAMLAGVRHFLPRSPDGNSLTGRLPVEPKPLLAIAERKDASGAAAQQLLTQLRWPGKAGADTVVRALTGPEQAQFEKGKAQFAALCAACHQPNGQGLAGLAPSLVYSKWVLGDERILARIVLNGKVQENLIMPPWKAALDDESIAALLTYLRRSWGNEADPVPPASVATARAAVAGRDEPFTEADLQEIARTMRRSRR